MHLFWPNSCECILPLQGGNSAKLLVMPFAQKNHFIGLVKIDHVGRNWNKPRFHLYRYGERQILQNMVINVALIYIFMVSND